MQRFKGFTATVIQILRAAFTKSWILKILTHCNKTYTTTHTPHYDLWKQAPRTLMNKSQSVPIMHAWSHLWRNYWSLKTIISNFCCGVYSDQTSLMQYKSEVSFLCIYHRQLFCKFDSWSRLSFIHEKMWVIIHSCKNVGYYPSKVFTDSIIRLFKGLWNETNKTPYLTHNLTFEFCSITTYTRHWPNASEKSAWPVDFKITSQAWQVGFLWILLSAICVIW